jgi:hypothetical protein
MVDFFTHNLIIDRAFVQLNWGDVIQEHSFRQAISGSLTRNNHFSPFLHLVVLAIGCRYLTEDEAQGLGVDFSDRGDIFADAAEVLLLKDCKDPNLATIRGLLALSAYKIGRGDE